METGKTTCLQYALMRGWSLSPAGLCVLVLLALSACADHSQLIHDCRRVAEMEPLCGWQRPEDMELLPDGHSVIVSEMAKVQAGQPGRLSLLDTRTDQRLPLPVHETITDAEYWGQAQCVASVGQQFGPHGLHLSRRRDGRLQLLVVNHGSRESVEMFEVMQTDGRYSLQWRGCALPPEGSFLNDVVALPGGGFIATHMYTKGDAAVGTLHWAEIKAIVGLNPGHLLRFDGDSFSRLGTFEGRYPNGIQISADGSLLYVNLWAESKLQKVDAASGQVLAQVDLPHPDNVQWDGRGRLLVTGHDFRLNDLRICLDLDKGACPGTFEVVAVNPDTLLAESLLRHRGPPMGAATVTQQVGNTWYLGSFVGDRILKLPAR